jgi:F-box protein 3
LLEGHGPRLALKVTNKMESDADGAPSLTLLDLPSSLIVEALSSLPATSASALACTSKSLASIGDDEALRKRHLNDTFGVTSLQPPPSMLSSTQAIEQPLSYVECFKSWTQAFSTNSYKPEIVKSALDAWTKVESFLATHIPSILHSLAPGATEEQLNQLESSLKVSLPPAFKVLYRFHNGQTLSFDERFDKAQRCPASPQVAPDASIAHGLFGGYSFYDNFKCVRMLSLSRVLFWTKRLRHHGWLASDEMEEDEGWLSRRGRLVVFAASFDIGKIFVVDSESAEVFLLSGGRLQSCCPVREDPILAWFMQYAQRLSEGWYPVKPLHEALPFDTKGISLFADKGCSVSVAVTRGVQVKVSTIFAAELSREGQHTFPYSVRFQLLHRDSQSGESGGQFLSSCQLNARHWMIFDDEGALEDEIRGEAVIGLHPHLQEGGPEFAYQSCTRAQISSKTARDHNFFSTSGAMPPLTFELGRMSGDFEFVEGSRSMPTGPTFDVICPSFSFSTHGGFLY